MGTFTVASYAYYTDGAGSYSNPTGYGTILSTYAEVSPNDDLVARPNEVVDPDYSTQPATYLGLVEFNGNTFLLMEDEFGSFLGSQSVLPLSAFPTSFLDGEVNNGATDTVQACFLAGTQISTPSGPVAVETLKIGDLVQTAEGDAIRVKWVGRQTVQRFFSGPQMQPVCIRAGALGDGLPHTDLTVTADHGMILDGWVINAAALVNFDTIDFVSPHDLPDQVTYFHVETENHQVILANGAPAETFVDAVSRQVFDNYSEYLDLYGAEHLIPEMPRPRIATQRLLPDGLRTRLGLGAQTVASGFPKTA